MGKPLLPFPRNRKKCIPINEKDALNLSCFECIVEHFLVLFILCEEFIFNVENKKQYLRNFSKIKDRNFSRWKFFKISRPNAKKRKQTKNVYDPQKLIAQNTMLFEVLNNNNKLWRIGEKLFYWGKILEEEDKFCSNKNVYHFIRFILSLQSLLKGGIKLFLCKFSCRYWEPSIKLRIFSKTLSKIEKLFQQKKPNKFLT